ncbi:hypothetical protein [Candidatus Mycoplasma haematominutum]|uniref:Uncharacterized protein n=1 Tax=Candidatus Mycoplasma haematominutum 'Birmingham 1' TaxID=1116213 RepID=G8C2Q2_9MOLU|nr:hypothetical protein [Candidatus Mycoplasma haematominutum]CCE66600.1 hypothetical protein MHM_00820 [Candidatus Mycoplasma haematominutum 'Birmingham 1']
MLHAFPSIYFLAFSGLGIVSVAPLMYSNSVKSFGGGQEPNRLGVGEKYMLTPETTLISQDIKMLDLELSNSPGLNIVPGERFKNDNYISSNVLEKIYQLLQENRGINSMAVLSPAGKWPIKGFNPELSIEEQPRHKAYLISFDSSGRDSYKVMRAIFTYFLSPNWKSQEVLNPLEELVDHSIRYEVDNSKNNLIFTRKYENNYYYLKIGLDMNAMTFKLTRAAQGSDFR